VLAVSASPADLPPLDLEDECQKLAELARIEPEFEVSFLHHASASAMREALAGGIYHVLHFMGHGDFEASTGEGALYFEQPDSSAERVSARTFAARLRDLRTVGLVTLNACNTGRASHRRDVSPFRGVATALVLGGLPAVVAMQHPISDAAAIAFSHAFYRSLGRGIAVDEALTEGRQAILSASPESCEWAIPILFLRVADGNVFVQGPAVAREETPIRIELEPARLPPPEASTHLSTRAGRFLPKLAAATGGVALLTLTVYAGIEGFDRAGSEDQAPPSQALSDLSLTTSDRQSESASPRKRAFGSNPSGNGKEGRSPHGVQASNPVRPEPPLTSESHPPRASESLEKGDRQIEAETMEGGARTPERGVSQNASALESRVVGIARRSGQGLRIRVVFQNTGDRPLALVLDRTNSMLADDLGKTHRILAASLPTSGSANRLDLPVRGVAEGYFDFPAPEIKAQEFTLVLAASGGDSLNVSHAVKSIQGPP
jgi:hypothetical protein